MTGGSITASLDRIEAVLDRLEAAAQEAETMAAPPAPDLPPIEPLAANPDEGVNQETHADLERRHANLRSAVSASLARLDTLIAQEGT